MTIWQAAVEAPWLAFCAIVAVYYAIKLPFTAFRLCIRSRNIAKNGWPTNPLMDADGDIVHPTKGN